MTLTSDLHWLHANMRAAVPKAFAMTAEDLSDLAKLQFGQEGICSRCAKLPLDACFSDVPEAQEKSVPWSTPLSRVVLHAVVPALSHTPVNALSFKA